MPYGVNVLKGELIKSIIEKDCDIKDNSISISQYHFNGTLVV